MHFCLESCQDIIINIDNQQVVFPRTIKFLHSKWCKMRKMKEVLGSHGNRNIMTGSYSERRTMIFNDFWWLIHEFQCQCSTTVTPHFEIDTTFGVSIASSTMAVTTQKNWAFLLFASLCGHMSASRWVNMSLQEEISQVGGETNQCRNDGIWYDFSQRAVKSPWLFIVNTKSHPFLITF